MNNADFWKSILSIIDDGFTDEGLQKLDHYAELLINGRLVYKRFSPFEQHGCATGGATHVAASLLAGAKAQPDSGVTPYGNDFKREVECGAQQAECIELWARRTGCWTDVKRSGKHLHLEFHQQKTDTYERLPLCAEAEALLRGQKRGGEYVFKEETNQKVNVVLKRWCKEVKIKKPVSFHSARHTFCVLLLTKEVPIYTVQQLMCHSDIGTTKVYADLLNKTKAKAVKRLPSIMC